MFIGIWNNYLNDICLTVVTQEGGMAFTLYFSVSVDFFLPENVLI